MNAQQIINALIAIETDSTTAPDERDVIRDERRRLQSAVQRSRTTLQSGHDNVRGEDYREMAGSRDEISEYMDEAVRVARMWGHEAEFSSYRR